MIAVALVALAVAGAALAFGLTTTRWVRDAERDRAEARVDAAVQTGLRKAEAATRAVVEAQRDELAGDLQRSEARAETLEDLLDEKGDPVPAGAGWSRLREGLRAAARARAGGPATGGAPAAGALPAQAAAGRAAPGAAAGGGMPGGRT